MPDGIQKTVNIEGVRYIHPEDGESYLTQLTVIDLFSGCGGMSLGFQKAGFEILGGVEIDPKASEIYAKNLFRHKDAAIIQKHSHPRDIYEYSPQDFAFDFLQTDHFEGTIDVIIGGPPCQAFARIGRAKLREIMDHQDAFLNDHRADLYIHFLMYVEEFRPKVIVIENVPEILKYGGRNVADDIAVALDNLGYIPGYSILNAAHFGVPQTRVRFFLVAFRRDLKLDPIFPKPSHYVNTNNDMHLYMIKRYEGKSSKSQCSFFQDEEVNPFKYYYGLIEPDISLPDAITVREAIHDLPPIFTSHIDGSQARYDFTTLRKYRRGRPSGYASKMRRWHRYEAGKGITDHVIRYLPRDYEIFRRMKLGDQYPAAHKIAEEIFDEKIKLFEEEHGFRPIPGTKEYSNLRKSTVPPYATIKFPNKWQKLKPNKSSHTITAHLGKDTYSHIHYDSEQARVISVREAARLQSFPDGFEFPHTLSHSLRQIGNAVPPLLAYKIAKSIKQTLEGAHQ